jgi:hypothetical protein
VVQLFVGICGMHVSFLCEHPRSAQKKTTHTR